MLNKQKKRTCKKRAGNNHTSWSVNIYGDGNGAHIQTHGRFTHNINDKTQVYIQGNLNRNQSFQGGGGQNTYGGSVGIKYDF